MTEVDMQAEAERDWWRDSHDIAEAKRQQLEKVLRASLKDLDAAVDTDTFREFWELFQRVRKRMQKELA